MATAGGISLSLGVLGDAQTARKLEALAPRIQKRILRQALRPAAKLIQAAAQANIHSRSGGLAGSVKVRAGKRSRRFPDRVSVLVQTSAGWYRGEGYYGAFVNWGHRIGKRSLGGARALVPGQRFMERAAEQTKAQAEELARRLIAQAIEQEAKSNA